MYQKISILMIEDEKSICDFISKTLNSHQYKVNAAHNGKDGLTMITSSLPDLVLLDLGLIYTNIQWLADVNYIVGCVIVVLLWSSLGVSFLTFTAGLQNVDRSLYEAGAIDGVRNRWQELWYITLPYMRPQLLFGAIMSITSGFSVGDQITALAGYPTQDYVAHTMVLHMQDYGGTRMEMGYACAVATLLFLLMVVSNKLVQKLLHKVGD